MSAINITALTDALGAYCREHRDVLLSEILLNEDLQDRFTVLDEVTDELPLPSLTLTDLIKPNTNPANWAPTTNALNFGARPLKVRPIKVDLVLIPQVLEKTWLGKMKDPRNPFEMPFEGFIMNYIAQKAKENMHLQGVFKGVFNGAGTTPIDTMDGFLKIIADEITATNITPVVTGALNSGNVIANLEKVYDALGEAYKNMPTQMFVSPAIFDLYTRAYRTSFGANNDYGGVARVRVSLDGTLCEVVREPGLAGSQRVICTPKENTFLGVDTLSDYNLDIQKEKRSINVLMDFKAGVNFGQIHGRALAVNDQA
jgi:hypothetical protein